MIGHIPVGEDDRAEGLYICNVLLKWYENMTSPQTISLGSPTRVANTRSVGASSIAQTDLLRNTD